MTSVRRGRLGQALGSLALVAAAGALSLALVKYGLKGAIVASGALIATGTVGLVGVRHGARMRRQLVPSLVGVEDQLAAVLVGAWVFSVTFNGIQVVNGVSLGDVPLLGAAVMAGMGAVRRLRPRVASLPRWLYIATYLLLVAGVAGPLVVGGGVSQNLVPVFRFAVTLFGVPAVLSYVAWAPARRRLYVHLWLVSVAINCVVAIADRAGARIGATVTGFDYSFSAREAGLTQHPTHLGLVCAMALPAAFTLALDRTARPVTRLSLVALSGLIAWAIVLAGSRTALLAAAVASLTVLVFVEHTRKGLAAVLAAVVGLAAMAAILSPAALSSVSPLPSRTGADIAQSNSGHLTDVQNAQTLFLGSPLVGTGFQSARSAQNIYLQLLEAGGIVALLGFGTFVVGVFRAGVRVIRQAGGPEGERALAGALIAGTGAWLAEGLFQPPIYDRYLYLPAGLIMAMALSTTRLRGRSRTRRAQLPAGVIATEAGRRE